MGFFKSPEEKEAELQEKIKKKWNQTSEYKLGITFEESKVIRKKFQKALIDASGDIGSITDFEPINILFPDLTPEQKVLILYYARWMDEIEMHRNKIV